MCANKKQKKKQKKQTNNSHNQVGVSAYFWMWTTEVLFGNALQLLEQSAFENDTYKQTYTDQEQLHTWSGGSPKFDVSTRKNKKTCLIREAQYLIDMRVGGCVCV
jgi:hypothetical protein